MITSKESRIIDLYIINIFASHTIREIMKKIGTKSYNWTHSVVTYFIKRNILTAEKKGKSTLCRFNLDDQTALSYISYVEEIKSIKANIPKLKKILSMVDLNYFTLIIAGSYAKGKATAESDLDVVVIVDKKKDATIIMNRLMREGELMIPSLHPYVFTDDEFYQMLLSEDENYGKEIFRNHLIVHGAEGYYNILKKAVKNGFRG